MRTAKSSKAEEPSRALTQLVAELAELLAPAEAAALAAAPRTSRPIVLVVGAPRSGATLIMQWLAASGLVAYPSNVLARFAHAPAIGARIQRLLLDPVYAHKDELGDLAPAPPGFTSELGRTSGALAPHEFTEFWRRFLPTREVEPLGARTSEVDLAGLRRALAALTSVFERPFAAKAPMLQFDLPHFTDALPEAIVLHVVRDGVANARSILEARKRLLGSYERWHGARPPEYWDLVALPPADQAAGQVHHTNRHIAAALASLPAARALRCEYEAFCAAPARLHAALLAALTATSKTLGQTFEPGAAAEYQGPGSFTPSDRRQAKGAELEAVPAAWARFSDV
ncbi:MAG: sulfotransferase [Planctomycetota bacterium]